MSTRCQVKITQKGISESKEAVTLYHHCDGYPTGMVPLIASAYKPDWKHGRIGKAIAYVIAEDPDGYDVEPGHKLHRDIEWYYVLEIESETHVKAIPEWTLTVYRCDGDNLKDFTKVYSGPIDKAIKLAERMESGE